MHNSPHTPSIECIDGKDDHLLLPFEAQQELILGHHPSLSGVPLKSLREEDGFVIFRFDDQGLHLDAGQCNVTVKLNGDPVETASSLNGHDIIKIGDDVWRINDLNDAAQAHNPLFSSGRKGQVDGT